MYFLNIKFDLRHLFDIGLFFKFILFYRRSGDLNFESVRNAKRYQASE